MCHQSRLNRWRLVSSGHKLSDSDQALKSCNFLSDAVPVDMNPWSRLHRAFVSFASFLLAKRALGSRSGPLVLQLPPR